MELLLELVERKRLPIVEVSLAAVADQYLSQLRELGETDAETLAEFLRIGSQLVVLKSRAMLPHLGGERDCGLEEDDLVGRLATYRSFKLLAQTLAEIERRESTVYGGGSGRIGTLEVSTGALARISVENLGVLMREIRGRQVDEQQPHTRPWPRVTVADRLAMLNQRLAEHGSLDWTAVAGKRVDEIVATLLAVLELVRRGRVRIDQGRLFGPIRLSALEDGAVPSSGDAAVGQAELA